MSIIVLQPLDIEFLVSLLALRVLGAIDTKRLMLWNLRATFHFIRYNFSSKFSYIYRVSLSKILCYVLLSMGEPLTITRAYSLAYQEALSLLSQHLSNRLRHTPSYREFYSCRVSIQRATSALTRAHACICSILPTLLT